MNEESGRGSQQDEQRREPNADATSKETLKDLEDNQKKTGTSGSESGESDVPSPDGAHDAGRDKPDDAGPM